MNQKDGTTSSLRSHLLHATLLFAAVACLEACTGATPTTGGAPINTAREPVVSYQCGCAMAPVEASQFAAGSFVHSRGHSGKD